MYKEAAMEESQMVDTQAGHRRRGWPIDSWNKLQLLGLLEFEEDHIASLENVQNEEEIYQDEQSVEEESNEAFTQPAKRRRRQQWVKSIARTTNKGFCDRIQWLENLMLEVTARIPPRQPQA